MAWLHHHAMGHGLGFTLLIALHLPWEIQAGRAAACTAQPWGGQPSSCKGLQRPRQTLTAGKKQKRLISFPFSPYTVSHSAHPALWLFPAFCW